MPDGSGASAPPKDAPRISGMFDAIAGRYDFLNHLLSAGLDRRWRQQAVDALGLTGGEIVLDICTGTADLALAAVSARPGARRVVGVDFSTEMLRIGSGKARAAGPGRVQLVRGDAASLPARDGSCDAATIGFGIRNVDDPTAACREIARVLRPGGTLAILEFSLPDALWLRRLYRWYFRRVLPLVGRVVSRHPDAYTYLPLSVEAFPSPAQFAQTLRECGFGTVRAQRLTFGIVYLFVATKRGYQEQVL